MTPLFSIIIPVYKVENYLRKCLDSVVKQTCGDWECICVDDGSPDNCGAILDEYKVRLIGRQRFEVIHQKNAGVSAARNAALDVAEGQWVQFLDSDDSLKLDFLEKLKADIESHPEVDAIEHTAIYCQEDGGQIYEDGKRLPPEGVLTGDDILSDPFGKKYTNLGRCSCYKIFRRSVIEKAGLRFTMGMPLSEDELFAAQFYAYAGKVALCPKTAGYLRIMRGDSAMGNVSLERLKPMVKGAELLHETWLKHPTSGMTIRTVAWFVVLGFLGANSSCKTRSECIEFLLNNEYYNKTCIPFIIRYGSWKAKTFALAYKLSPKSLKKKILLKLGMGR